MADYSLVHLTAAELSPPELIRLAARAGYERVSLRGIPMRIGKDAVPLDESKTGKQPVALADDRKVLLETKHAALEEGVKINDIENARIFEGVDIKKYRKDLEAAAELGVQDVLTNIWISDKHSYEEKFIELCEIALEYSMRINLEFCTWSCIPGIKEAAELLKKANQPNVGIVLDTLHFYRSGNVLRELEGLPQQWFKYVHLCDCPKIIPTGEELVRTGIEERLIPGEGSVEIKNIINMLPSVVRGLEIPNKKRVAAEGIENYVIRALVATKQYLS